MSGASATGEIMIFRFLLLLVCTPVCGVDAATAAAPGRAVSVACAAVASATKDGEGELQQLLFLLPALAVSPVSSGWVFSSASVAHELLQLLLLLLLPWACTDA